MYDQDEEVKITVKQFVSKLWNIILSKRGDECDYDRMLHEIHYIRLIKDDEKVSSHVLYF